MQATHFAAFSGCLDCDVACSWLPLSHDMGFVGMFLTCVVASGPAYGGSHLALQTPETFLADPTTWLRTCSEQGATLTTAPNFAFELACRTRAFLPDVDLSRLRMCITGAERVQAATLRRFADDFAGAGLDPAGGGHRHGCVFAASVGFLGEGVDPVVDVCRCELLGGHHAKVDADG